MSDFNDDFNSDFGPLGPNPNVVNDMSALPLAYLTGDIPVLGPIGIGITGLTTTASTVIAADPVRHGILFHNPSLTIVKRIAPVGSSLSVGVGGVQIYPQSDFSLFDDDYPLLNLNCEWIALTDDASDGVLTIFDFTDNNNSVPAPEPVSTMNYAIPNTSPVITQMNNLTSTPIQVIGSNANRRGIIFQNPNSEVVYVCPSNVTPVQRAGSWTVLPGQERRIFAKGRVRVNCAWNAFAAAPGNNQLTILDFV
jgi:hypothetical protein